MKAVKITNPLWLGIIAAKINAFTQKVPTEGITYESVYAFLAQVVQFGGDTSEFWVAYNEDKPVAFARWQVRGLPHIGKVYGDFFYSWARNQKAISLLVDEFLNFGKRHNAPVYDIDFVNDKVYQHFTKVVEKKGIVLTKQNRINCIGRFK